MKKVVMLCLIALSFCAAPAMGSAGRGCSALRTIARRSAMPARRFTTQRFTPEYYALVKKQEELERQISTKEVDALMRKNKIQQESRFWGRLDNHRFSVLSSDEPMFKKYGGDPEMRSIGQDIDRLNQELNRINRELKDAR